MECTDVISFRCNEGELYLTACRAVVITVVDVVARVELDGCTLVVDVRVLAVLLGATVVEVTVVLGATVVVTASVVVLVLVLTVVSVV